MAPQDVSRLLGCRIGDVTIEVNGAPELDPQLQVFRSRVADFSWAETSPDLTLNIFLPDATSLPSPASAVQARAEAFVCAVMQKATSPQQRFWSPRKAADFTKLLACPEVCPWLDALAREPTGPTCVPLEAGFLLFDMRQKTAILLLNNKPSSEYGSGSDDLWLSLINITVINAVMCSLSFRLAMSGGVIAHALGLCHRGAGYVVAAASGGGKTTLSRNSPAGAVLADDGLVIRRQGDLYMLYPTPFRQLPGGDAFHWDWHKAPVVMKGLCLLEKGAKTGLADISRMKAVDLLLRASTHFFFWMRPEAAVSVFDFWRDLLAGLPFARLKWRKDDAFLETLEQLPWREIPDEEKKGSIKVAPGI